MRCKATHARPLPSWDRIVGLKAPAVHDRVKRLEQRGYIQRYSAQLDAKRLGLLLTAFVSLYTAPDCNYDDFTRTLGEMPEVCEVHSVAGEETFVCKVVDRLDETPRRLARPPEGNAGNGAYADDHRADARRTTAAE